MMKKQIFLVLACLVGVVQAFASGCDPDYCNDCLDFDSKLTVDLGGGLRWDDISFKTNNGFTTTHDRLKDIKIGQIQGDVQFLACEHFLLKGYFDYGWVYGKSHRSTTESFGGFSSSSDFSSDGFSSHSRKGHAYDLYGAVGYQFNWDCYQVAVAPLVGYSYNYLQLDRGHESAYSPYGFSGSSSGRNATKFRLSGPWLGFAATYQATCELLFYADYAFHWATFRSRASDNFLFGDVSNHIKSKNVHGNEVVVGATYALCDCWVAGLNFNYRNWYASKKGHHSSSSSVYNPYGDRSRLRNFDWNTYIVSLDIGYSF